MKKLSLFVVFALIFSLFPAAGALPPDIGGGDFDGYIVKLKDIDGPRLFSDVLKDLDAVCPGENLFRADDPAEIEKLDKLGLLEYAEPNYTVSLFALPDDPLYEYQWALQDIGIEAAWDAGLTGEGVKIALIDSGLNAGHEDLAGVSILQGENFMDGTSDVTDTLGHGTFIGGIIAAASNNGKGIAGMTSDVSLIPLKCFQSTSDTSVEYIYKAIYRAIDYYEADIINLSLGVANNLRAFREAIDYAESRNVVILSAVGNNYNTTLFYPAAYDTVIGVGSVDKRHRHSTFSQINSSVFVVAPGEDLTGLGISSNSAYYSEQSGTSFAAPHVTALVAMALDYNPKLTAAQIRDVLAASSDDLGTSGYDHYFGHGLINVEEFVAQLATYGNGNTAPEAVQETHSASALYAGGKSESAVVNMDGWFTDEEGDKLSYVVYSSTAAGKVLIDGSILTFAPAASDADKSVRLIIEARDRELKSEMNAILVVGVTSEGRSEESLARFVDLDGHWARKFAAFAVETELINGMDKEHFAPDTTLSRAMFVTLLGRLSGDTMKGYTHEYLDVPDGMWYTDSVAWASFYGIVAGVDPGQFGPDVQISRQQIAAFIYRFAMQYGLIVDSTLPGVYYGYTDTAGIADWAADAMLWAVSNGIIGGRTGTTLDPDGNATRAEAAAILLRFVNTFMSSTR